MSKELIEQLAKEHGADLTDWQDGREAEITFYGGATQLEAFAKAYQAKQPVNVLIEALQKMATYPSTPKDELSATGMRKIASDAIAAYQSAAPIDNVACECKEYGITVAGVSRDNNDNQRLVSVSIADNGEVNSYRLQKPLIPTEG